MSMEDRAKEVRQGEELDAAAVEAFLRDNIPGLSGALEIRQFPGGFSNLTYLVSVGDTELVLRRPPRGADIKSAHDMGREYRILKALKPVFPCCPEALAYTEDESIMGCPFYVMERVRGIILRRDLPAGLELPEDQARRLCEKLQDLQADLHEIDVKAVGLEELGKPEGYVERQVQGWCGRYEKARTDNAPGFEKVMDWIKDNMPPDTDRPAIVHNDYKFDNVVLDPADPMNIIGVLDWEMATYGDPLMDLGNSLAYWIQADDPPETQMMRLMPTHIPGALTRDQLVARYAERTGRDVSNFDYYYCFGLFRLAVIAQQIYRRYHLGHTKDKRFANLIFAVQLLEMRALNVVKKACK